MNCDCAIDIDDYERPQVHVCTTRRARVSHVCCECGAEIAPGQQYEHVSSLYEGPWSRIATCILCARIRADLCSGGWVYGELRETICECLGFDYVTGEETP